SRPARRGGASDRGPIQGPSRGAVGAVGLSLGTGRGTTAGGTGPYAGCVLVWRERCQSGASKLEEGARAFNRAAALAVDRHAPHAGVRANHVFRLVRRDFGGRSGELF